MGTRNASRVTTQGMAPSATNANAEGSIGRAADCLASKGAAPPIGGICPIGRLAAAPFMAMSTNLSAISTSAQAGERGKLGMAKIDATLEEISFAPLATAVAAARRISARGKNGTNAFTGQGRRIQTRLCGRTDGLAFKACRLSRNSKKGITISDNAGRVKRSSIAAKGRDNATIRIMPVWYCCGHVFRGGEEAHRVLDRKKAWAFGRQKDVSAAVAKTAVRRGKAATSF